MLAAVADALGDTGAPTAERVAAGVDGAVRSVDAHGGAGVGDKTLVDALVPFATTLRDAVASGSSLPVAWRDAADAAERAAAATAALRARKGRARTHGDHSVGTPDPGAVSLAHIVRTVGDALAAAAPTLEGLPS